MAKALEVVGIASIAAFCLLGNSVALAQQGFQVRGCVNEFPGLRCSQIGETVTLEPLGLISGGPASLYFTFQGVPPGTYTLQVSPRCNPFGCWPGTPVSVTDHDVFVAIDLVSSCPGDCDGDFEVSIAEILTGVRIALGELTVEACAAMDTNGDGEVSIDELVAAVQSALAGCSVHPFTPGSVRRPRTASCR